MLITIVVSIVLVIIGIVLVVKKERFTGTAVIHPIIMSQAPQSVQDSNTNMNNIISTYNAETFLYVLNENISHIE